MRKPKNTSTYMTELIKEFLTELNYNNVKIREILDGVLVGSLGDNVITVIYTTIHIKINLKRLTLICNKYTTIDSRYYFEYTANSLEGKVKITLVKRIY